MASYQGTPLSEISGWPEAYALALADKAIGAAEQVVAIAATPNGIESLAIELGITPEEMRRLVALARAALSPEAAGALETPARPGGLGALPTTDDDPSP